MADAVATVGGCFNFRVLFDDSLFTCEPLHIKVQQLKYISPRLPTFVQAILATDFDNFVKGRQWTQ